MNALLSNLARPVRVAGIEVQIPFELPTCLDDFSPSLYAIVPASRSPDGFRWFDVHVDASLEPLRFYEAAHAILLCLTEAAHAHGIEAFRIIDGSLYVESREFVQRRVLRNNRLSTEQRLKAQQP